jgi:hypothetical protein
VWRLQLAAWTGVGWLRAVGVDRLGQATTKVGSTSAAQVVMDQQPGSGCGVVRQGQ